MTIEPGTTIAHYRVAEKLGEGGMGEVWKALDTRLKREVAIKILPPALVADEARRLRFQREAETAASLSHPNIAVIHEVGEHEGTPYLVMELLRGRTLKEAVGRRGLPPKEWLEFAMPIASALAHAHKSGIVHRDLKSANVMVTDDGHVKLLDFGLAKVLEPDSLPDDATDVHSRMQTISRELTRQGHVLGTVAYMSPEQARGDTVDHRSDIFSFGVLLYELATGKFPFSGDTDIEALNATLNTDPQTLSTFVPDLPAEADRIVAKALEKEPGRRYQHAEDMVTDFRNLKRDLDTGRVSTVSGPAPVASRSSRSWIVPVVALAVLAGLFAIFQLRPGGDTDSSDASAAAPVAAVSESRRIVVLPFENQGEAADEFFADGVTEEIIGRLSAVRDISVISRSSAFQYDRSGKTMQQIGEDFQVDYILDGTVRWAKSDGADRVRISPQLVRVADDTGVWGERYDAEMNDIFQVQTDIAGEVIGALGVALGAGERETLEAKPTDNQEAYQAYLRGMDAILSDPMQPLPVQMLERAVELDPGFHEAWAGLSRAHSWRHHGGDRGSGQCEAAKAAADEAVRLAPTSFDGRMALGLYYYRCFRDYDRALAELEIAGRERPNDIDLIAWKGTLSKRQGKLREAAEYHLQAMELDPMDGRSANELATIYSYARNYPEAAVWYDRARSITPESSGSYMQKAQLYYRWKGTTDEAREVIDAMPATGTVRHRAARFELEYLSGNYQAALDSIAHFPETFEDQTTLVSRDALEAMCREGMGDAGAARESLERAAEVLERKRLENPDDFRPYSDLGPILALLDRGDEALAAARRAIELMPATKDAEAAVAPQDNFALVLTLLGDFDAAFDEIRQRLTALPGELTIATIRLDPKWRKLVEHPDFEEFVREFE